MNVSVALQQDKNYFVLFFPAKHLKQYNYICHFDECQRRFATRQELRKHLSTVHFMEPDDIFEKEIKTYILQAEK